MQKYISLLLISLMLALPTVSAAQDTAAEASTSDAVREASRIEGRAFASENYQGWRWFGAGAAGGFALGLIGAGIAVGFSQTGTAVPPATELARLQNEAEAYAEGFKLGYHQKARSKALGKCILGGVAGIAAGVAAVMVLMSTDTGDE